MSSENVEPHCSTTYGSIQPTTNLTSRGSADSTETTTESTSSSANLTTPDDSCDHIPIDQMRSSLTFYQKFGYGLGHVYNDLCAGVWFSYTLLFLQGVVQLPSEEAGSLVMLGQIGDAIATPIVGILADKFGTKFKWHIGGTILVTMTFSLIFSICPLCGVWPSFWPPLYFSTVILIFQLGWAIVQITHLAMIPEMSRTRKDRADLTAVRYSASVCANVTVYIVTWAVLHARSKVNPNIVPDDAYRFRDISLILSLAGIVMTILFYFSLLFNGYDNRRRQALANSGSPKRCDAQLRQDEQEEESQLLLNDERRRLSIPPSQPTVNFMKSPRLYQNAFLYVFSRLFMTTALVYIPLWLDERAWKPVPTAVRPFSNTDRYPSIIQTPLVGDADDASVEHIATVPLVSFTASFVASLLMKGSTRFMGHRMAYFIGSLISIVGCIWVALAVPPTASSVRLFGIAVLFGAGSSITMISSLCITADMIGRHADQSGFIYSAVTFADKLITGIVVIIIETLKCEQRKQCPEYYRNVLSYVCGTAAIFGLLTLLTMQFNNTRQRRQRLSTNFPVQS